MAGQTNPTPILFIRCVVLLSFYLCSSLPPVNSLKFDFGSLTLGSLKLLGDAHLKNGSIHLTKDLPVPNSGAGRALYSDPVQLRDPATGNPLPFSTFFSFSITLLNPSSIGGGLAFVVSPDDLSVGDSGPYLGLLSSADDPPGSLLAVEFDTLMDVQFEDINGNHAGVDLGSMVSAQAADLEPAGIDLKSGRTINAWIDYTKKGTLDVSMSYSADRPEKPVLSFPLDLGKYVSDVAFVGFSASTQGSTEVHSIEWWSFSSPSPATGIATPSPVPPPSPPIGTNPGTGTVIATTPPPPAPPIQGPISSITAASAPSNSTSVHPSSSNCHGNGRCKPGTGAVAGVATASAFVAASFAGFALWVFVKKVKRRNKTDELAAASEIVSAPRVFTYRELSAATRGFEPARIIGHGAFGTVYKGIVPETGAIVAVKKCIQKSGSEEMGRAEFLSELSIIAGLRHRNLVRLQGWCCEKGEILLVYDYMLHGSLDKALFDPDVPPLVWRHRRKILIGVASALAYLHRECERRVIHRDVKSSNIMLDDGYHARLGDFGLARQTEHGKSPDATVTAGTMGYLAPEYLLTGRATEKTDVFSFGAVVLEVACGRRPIDSQSNSNLAEWVWRLHGQGRIVDAVDSRLQSGEYDEDEMRRTLLVGLACSSPDPDLRPGMRAVVQMLSGEADPPLVPTTRPSVSFSVNHQLLLSLQDSVSDYNAIVGLNLSSSSSSSSSLSSSLRSTLRGGGGCQDADSAV